MKASYRVVANKKSEPFEAELNQAANDGFKVRECGFSQASQVSGGGVFGGGEYYYPKFWAILEKLDD